MSPRHSSASSSRSSANTASSASMLEWTSETTAYRILTALRPRRVRSTPARSADELRSWIPTTSESCAPPALRGAPGSDLATTLREKPDAAALGPSPSSRSRCGLLPYAVERLGECGGECRALRCGAHGDADVA